MSADAAALLVGYGADATFGDPARWHPVAGFGALSARLERRVWRPSRLAGAIYAAVLVAGAALAAQLAQRRARARRAGRAMFLAATLWTALGGRSLSREGRAVADMLEREDLEGARVRVRALVGRETASLDAQQLSRAAVESLAENTADAVVAPLMYAALGGSGAVAAYRAANTLDAMVGHRSPRHERFGWAAARLDDGLTWPAARLAAVLSVLLAPLAGGCRAGAWRALRRDGAAHPSPNAGRLEAAFAGALGLRLGGANTYGERVEPRPTMGDGRPPAPADVRRAVHLSSAVGAAAALVCAVLRAGIRP
jgi:adenosylcobinamide-phosphate synthase